MKNTYLHSYLDTLAREAAGSYAGRRALEAIADAIAAVEAAQEPDEASAALAVRELLALCSDGRISAIRRAIERAAEQQQAQP